MLLRDFLGRPIWARYISLAARIGFIRAEVPRWAAGMVLSGCLVSLLYWLQIRGPPRFLRNLNLPAQP